MQLNQAQAISVLRRLWTEFGNGVPVATPQPISLEGEMVERGAQALFEFVFAHTERLDGQHLWANCDDCIKDGFRAEARAVLEAMWLCFADRNISLS